MTLSNWVGAVVILAISYAVHEQYLRLFKCMYLQPGYYLGHIIGHRGRGSLLSEFKSRGWVNSLCGYERDGARGFMFFAVSVDLTQEGIGRLTFYCKTHSIKFRSYVWNPIFVGKFRLQV